MAVYNKDDILGLMTDPGLLPPGVFCRDCYTPDEWDAAKEIDLITKKRLISSDLLFFCDRCGNQIYGPRN